MYPFEDYTRHSSLLADVEDTWTWVSCLGQSALLQAASPPGSELDTNQVHEIREALSSINTSLAVLLPSSIVTLDVDEVKALHFLHAIVTLDVDEVKALHFLHVQFPAGPGFPSTTCHPSAQRV
jgi:hypothetical protein